ncbi:extracellular solute-binding protein [Enterococcus sp. DIV0086]|uniref:extracellular solute-binding protein n=1 Tax=Enterococcus sp. DIV0086 TaxID=2774655 RepID=UPI003D2923A7
MNKKIFVLAGITILMITMSACGSSSKNVGKDDGIKSNSENVSKTSFPIVKDKLKLSMFAPNMGESNYADMAFLKEYSKKTNIEFDYTTPPLADVETKLNLVLGSGDAPDVIYASNITTDQIGRYGGSVLIPLEDYIDKGYMPNFKKILDKYPSVKKSISTPDGHIYTLPFLTNKYLVDDKDYSKKTIINQGSLWFNGEWLKKLNLEVPKTTDDLYKTLKAFKEKDPNGKGDEIPLSTSSPTQDKLSVLRPWIMSAFGVLSQEQQVDKNGKVTYGAIQDNYRDYLEFMHKLYSDKLLDQEVFSQSDDTLKAKGHSNRLGAFVDWYSYFATGKNTDEAMGDPMANPMTSKDSKKAVFPVSDGITNGTFALTNKCKNPAAALRWVDYFYSEKGAQELNCGPDETKGGYWHWDKNDKGEKVRVLNKDIPYDKADEARGKVTPDYGTVPPKVNAHAPIVLENKNDPVEDDKISQFSNKEAENKIKPAAKIAWPTILVSKENQDKIGSTMETDLLTYVQQSEASFIAGKVKLTDDTWKKYIETLKGIGVDKYTEIQQNIYDDWCKTK